MPVGQLVAPAQLSQWERSGPRLAPVEFGDLTGLDLDRVGPSRILIEPQAKRPCSQSWIDGGEDAPSGHDALEYGGVHTLTALAYRTDLNFAPFKPGRCVEHQRTEFTTNVEHNVFRMAACPEVRGRLLTGVLHAHAPRSFSMRGE